MDGVNAKTACRIASLTYRQLDYWDRTHLIKPSLQEATGIGSSRLYSFADLCTYVLRRCSARRVSVCKSSENV